MINLHRDINSLTDFKRNSNDFMKQMKETWPPVMLTVNGKAELVVQDTQSYQMIPDRLEQMEAFEGILRGLEQVERSEGRLASDVFGEFRKRQVIPNG